jgi:hypothetical protein
LFLQWNCRKQESTVSLRWVSDQPKHIICSPAIWRQTSHCLNSWVSCKLYTVYRELLTSSRLDCICTYNLFVFRELFHKLPSTSGSWSLVPIKAYCEIRVREGRWRWAKLHLLNKSRRCQCVESLTNPNKYLLASGLTANVTLSELWVSCKLYTDYRGTFHIDYIATMMIVTMTMSCKLSLFIAELLTSVII